MPHGVPGDEVHEKVAPLLGQVEELVARALDSVDLDRHDVLKDALHHALLFSVRAEAHVRLEVASV